VILSIDSFEHFEDPAAVPIRKLRPLACRSLQEFTTSIVRCRLAVVQ